MKNIVGQTPRGKDFYPRDAVINRIYRRLDSGNHLYLSAPRRSGKTAIMRALEDNPRETYIFIYLNVEDCSNPEDFFRLLAEELESSAAQGRLAKLGEKAKNVFERFLEHIKKVKIAGFEIETAGAVNKPGYAKVFEQLLREIETDGETVVIMVDEFPVAVENIAKAKGNEEAVRFLHANRAMRQRAGTGVRFVYTGSIGLPNVARKLDPAPTINDLNIVEIPPLSPEEGVDMSKKIFATYSIEVEEGFCIIC
ncbi:MAG: ATP-binding protein [Saprospirales bacterium]|nr:ATP-binding protein [Saprospirales bacterium]